MRHFETGAVRGTGKGKGRYDLIYPGAIKRLAHRMEFGITPKPDGEPGYPERNWETGIPDSSFVDSLSRHQNQWLSGDRSEDHLGAMLFNIQGLIYNEETLPSNSPLHDLPKRCYAGDAPPKNTFMDDLLGSQSGGVCGSHPRPGEREAPRTAVGSLAVGAFHPEGSYLPAYQPAEQRRA